MLPISMTGTDDKKDISAQSAWKKEPEKEALFEPDDLDIIIHKETGEAWLFHGPEIKFSIKSMDYDPEDRCVTVNLNNGAALDLGVKIQDLIAPGLAKATKIAVIQTKNGHTIKTIEVPFNVLNNTRT